MEDKVMKPCPFCGAEGCLRTIHNTSFPLRGKPKEWETYFVNCDNAGCPMNNAQEDGEMGGTLNDWKTKEEAIYAWNTRAPQGWQQMTPDTKFEDGEWVCFKFLSGECGTYRYDLSDNSFGTASEVLLYTTAIRLKFVRLPK